MNEPEQHVRRDRYREVCDILRNEWDPIGVGDSPGALHEYDGYAQSLLEMILRRATRDEIFAYLWWAETENMGLSGNRHHTEQIADRLTALLS